MGELIATQPAIAAMSTAAIAKAATREAEIRAEGNLLTLKTRHILHGGLYCRTVVVPAGTELVGVLIKIPTTVIVCGDAFVRLEGGWRHLLGVNELPASAGRKQVFIANEDTHITMVFPSKARTVAEAEREFTDEYDSLASHRADADEETIITGE